MYEEILVKCKEIKNDLNQSVDYKYKLVDTKSYKMLIPKTEFQVFGSLKIAEVK